ncbi:hypothetical protein BaRGS_00012356 [Batillaria attramentaria]|uniref:Uncharacterized protein n=1 Tax=Batillaria attramentaria TaxID=370345 RepID=A0ABD0LBC0_9CAEN
MNDLSNDLPDASSSLRERSWLGVDDKSPTTVESRLITTTRQTVIPDDNEKAALPLRATPVQQVISLRAGPRNIIGFLQIGKAEKI